MSDIKYFTKEGLEKLKQKLHKYKTVDRLDISRQIGEARDKGDLSENAEYDAAKEAQGHLETKIAKLESELANGRVMDESIVDTSKALILSTVRVLNHKVNKEFKFTLVSESEADIKIGKISVESPIGKVLLGTKLGDKVEAKVPSGTIILEVLEITR